MGAEVYAELSKYDEREVRNHRSFDSSRNFCCRKAMDKGSPCIAREDLEYQTSH